MRHAPLFPWIDDPSEKRDILLEGPRFAPRTLLAAYSAAWFPWPHEEAEHLWVCNHDRMLVAPPAGFHRSRSLRRHLRRGGLSISFDRAFERVIARCAEVVRADQEGTWITPELMRGFVRLHGMGLAHSIEVWRGSELVGGLYGLALGRMMCGESMFHEERDASKVAMAALCAHLDLWGFHFLDCQVHTDHLHSLGARVVARPRFLTLLREALTHPHREGAWRVEPGVLLDLGLRAAAPPE